LEARLSGRVTGPNGSVALCPRLALSDAWPTRLMFSQALRYGYKCVFVSADLYKVEPMAYTFLVNFAKDNQLKVTSGKAPPPQEDNKTS